MKKVILILSLVLSFNAYSEIVTGDKCGDNCTWTFDTNTGKLTVSGIGDMYDWTMNKISTTKLWEKDITHYQTTAPWKEYSTSIQTIDIQDGITSIGAAAFYNTTVSDVVMPNSITKIATHAFQYAANLTEATLPKNLTNIEHAAFADASVSSFVIPESLQSFGTYPFYSQSLENLVFEGDVDIKKNMFSNNTGYIPETLSSIYCQASNTSCQGFKNDEQIGDKINVYEKQGGVYILENGTKFLSAADMAGGTNICNKELNECKRAVLEAKGICQGSSCDTFIQSDGNYMLKFGGKTYQNINALLKGDYDRRRIYTIEEANFVAGDKNRVSIKYR